MNLHPILKEYVYSGKQLREILEINIKPNQFLENVLLSIIINLKQNIFNEKLINDLDLAIVKGHKNQDLYSFFIAMAIHYTTKLKQIDKSKSLYEIGLSTLNDNSHFIIRAEYLSAQSHIKFLEGRMCESKQIMAQAVSILDKKLPIYNKFLVDYARKLAIEGELNVLNEFQIKSLRDSDFQKTNCLFTEMNIVNNVILANYNSACELLKTHQIQFPKRRMEDFENAKNELKLISGDFNESSYKDILYKKLALIYNSLLNAKTEEAIEHYRWLLRNEWQSFKAWRYVEFIPLHLQLNVGKVEMARQLLEDKKQRGRPHYLDDFFYLRVLLLENNNKQALQVYNLLISNIQLYGATNRLAFEMQFAKEIKLNDFFLLTQNIKNQNQIYNIEAINDSCYNKSPKDMGINLIAGTSSKISQVKSLIKKFASINSPILITGETGTGKELVSRALHEEGPNSHEPFLAINCGSLTDTLLQSELFGYVAGSFTGAQKERIGIFEAAGLGTVFLDEFGDISPFLQVSLLRVLEENEIRMIGSAVNKKIKCKIIVATNVDLYKAVIDKKFREDLFYRLIRVEIKLPSLRERIEDLPILAEYFMGTLNKKFGNSKVISSELINKFMEHNWPGNIRELKNEIERIYMLHFEKNIIDSEDFEYKRFKDFKNVTNNSLRSSAKEKQEKDQNKPIEFNPLDENIIKVLNKGSKVDRRHTFLKELFIQHKKLTRSQIIEILNICQTTASIELQKLIDEGFIVRRAPTNSPRTYYFELIPK